MSETNFAVTNDMLVRLEVVMRDLQGNVLDRGTLAYWHGHSDIFPVVELALNGKHAGDHVRLKLEPHEAFGDFDENDILIFDESDFDEGVAVGLLYESVKGAGLGKPYRVTDIEAGKVILDGNHPLAGIGIDLEITILGVEPAPEEMAGPENNFLSVVDQPKFNLTDEDD